MKYFLTIFESLKGNTMKKGRFIIDKQLPSLNEYITKCRTNPKYANTFKQKTEQSIGIYIIKAYRLGELPVFGNTPCIVKAVWYEKKLNRDVDNIQSGINIDKATAAMGTMIASTQQGGEVAGRAFKGIVMNLQQVKAEADEIGDGGEAITDESLTKYEKACADLGVSLKEVKNGISVLRDPMEVLNELAVAFNKEADNSIKKANLINAVGGKYRGNQLSALLSNWTMYEKMLAEFNSGEAVGSAMKEAVKTAESWEGRLNSLSNSWTKFVNNFVQSNTAKSGISSVEKLVNLFDTIVNKAGALKTILISIAAFKGFRNAGRLEHARLYTAVSYMCIECNTFLNKVTKLLETAKAL